MCRSTPKNNVCDEVLVDPDTGQPCDGFSVCLPFNRRLFNDGRCTYVEEPDTLPEDGIYGRIRVVDGCIVEALPDAVPQYTPPPCAPAPAPCTGGDGGSLVLSPDPRNLSAWDAAGQLLTTITFGSTATATFTGAGTPQDPVTLNISIPDSTTYLGTNSPAAIEVTGTGAQASPYMVNLRTTGITPGDYLGFTVDQYGRITGYDAETSDAIYAIVEGPGITVNSVQGVATISITQSFPESGYYQFGGYRAQIDLTGRFIGLTQLVNIEAGIYDLEDMLVELSSTGDIMNLSDAGKPIKTSFSALFTLPTTSRSMSFSTGRQARFRFTYKGSLGAMTGNGLLPYVGGVALTINDNPVGLYALCAGGQIIGLEAISEAINAGDHTLDLFYTDDTTTFGTVGIIDVQLVSA